MGSINPDSIGHEASSLGIFFIFATNLFVLVSLELGIHLNPSLSKQLLQKESDAAHHPSRPLTASLSSIRRLSRELARLGSILGIAWLFEFHPPFAHSPRVWNRDLYYFFCLLLVLYALQDIRSTSSPEYLGRHQTEEWKGWMQFMFLLYHYFKAVEVYNAIRVMICCYVWMTGFGNFSYYFHTQDYSLPRVLQMLWRLNFLAIMCCLTMGNPYILYYICPLHTFFFLIVYVTMRLYSSLNHTKWIYAKFLVLALTLFLVYDVSDVYCGFNYIMTPWLSNTPIMGAMNGVQWEWYFRSTLDHWAVFHGMLFAYNYPMMVIWINKLEEAPAAKWFCAFFMFVLGAWWCVYVFPLDKQEYNVYHPYTSIIPLLVYVFFRNFTLQLRSSYSQCLHNIGKSTLETYIMQHHIWMTSNARTLITVFSEYPLINSIFVAIAFALLSQELYRITMSLRGMLLSDSLSFCVRSLSVITIALCLSIGLGKLCLASGILLNNGSITSENDSSRTGLINNDLASSSSYIEVPSLSYEGEESSANNVEPSNEVTFGSMHQYITSISLYEEFNEMWGKSSQTTCLLLTCIVTILALLSLYMIDKVIQKSSQPSSPSSPSSSSSQLSSPSSSSQVNKTKPKQAMSTKEILENDEEGSEYVVKDSAVPTSNSTFIRPTPKFTLLVSVLLWLTFSIFSLYIHHHPTYGASRYIAVDLLKKKYQATSYLTTATSSHSMIENEKNKIEKLQVPNIKASLLNQNNVCHRDANRGHWVESSPPLHRDTSPLRHNKAVSLLHEWVWDPSHPSCVIGNMGSKEAQHELKNGKVVVIGDSIARFTYYALRRLLGDAKDNAHNATGPKHSDIHYQFPGGGEIDFIWAPFSVNVTNRFNDIVTSDLRPSVILFGCGLWDALWTRDSYKFHEQLQILADGLTGSGLSYNPTTIWINPTVVVDNRLESPVKRQYMTNEIIQSQYTIQSPHQLHNYRDGRLIRNKGDTSVWLIHQVDGVIDGEAISRNRQLDSVDGVHYTDVVYDVMAQVAMNMIRNKREQSDAVSFDQKNEIPKDHVPCENARIYYALVLMLLTAVMVVFNDNFFGLTRLSSVLFKSKKLHVTWEEAYMPIFRRMNNSSLQQNQ